MARRVGDLAPDQGFVALPLSLGWPRHGPGDDPLEHGLRRSYLHQAAQPIRLLYLLDRLGATDIDLDGGNPGRVIGGGHITPVDAYRWQHLIPKRNLRQLGSDLDNVAI